MAKVGHGPMLAKLESEIPRGPGWTYEPKWDGFRTIVTVGDEIRLESRTDRPMVRFFPELVSLLEERRDGPFVADGEIVMVRPGRLAFDELQLRLHPAESRVRKLAARDPRQPDPVRPVGGGRRRSSGRSRSPSGAIGSRRSPSVSMSRRRRSVWRTSTSARISCSRRGPTISASRSDGSPTRPGSARTGSWRSVTTSRTCRAPVGG